MNCGIGDAQQNAKGLEAAMNDLALITGQRPVKTRAKASLAQFKIREGQPLGIAVTLRGNVSFLPPPFVVESYHLLYNINFVNQDLEQQFMLRPFWQFLTLQW